MEQEIFPLHSPLNAITPIPGSKSLTNRALLLAALANGRSTLQNVLFSIDTQVFLEALQALGVSVAIDQEHCQVRIQGVNGVFPAAKANIWCQDAGTAARFLLPACANSYGQFRVDGSVRMRQRPISPLLNVLRQQGVSTEPFAAKEMPFVINGQNGLNGGSIEIDSHHSSQFLSGLLMVAPFARTPMQIYPKNLISRPYAELTCQMMSEFGVQVIQEQDHFYVETHQKYSALEYHIEADISTASYFFAAAAVSGGCVKIPNVQRRGCKQGDIRFLNLLEQMGCAVKADLDGITVMGPAQLQGGFSVDMGDYSDTFMTLACIAPFADAPIKIKNLAHTRLQESDRVFAVAHNLKKLSVDCETGPDHILIYPAMPKAGRVDPFNDHRIAMAFSLIGLKVPGIIIEDANCVAKTCPDFFTRWQRLHANA